MHTLRKLRICKKQTEMNAAGQKPESGKCGVPSARMIPDQEIIADTADPDNQKINPHINDLLCVTYTAFFIFLAASARTRIVSSDLLVFADRTGLFLLAVKTLFRVDVYKRQL